MIAMGAKICTLSDRPRSCWLITRLYNRTAASAGERLLMSGAWDPPAANGAAAVAPGAGVSGAEREKRCPATSAINATRAIPATAQGNEEEKLRCSGPLTIPAAAPAATAVPQRWQKRAPGDSAAPHAEHGPAVM